MNDYVKRGVANCLVRHRLFNFKNYEAFARTVLFLVKKYGVGGERDYTLGDYIQAKDEEYLAMPCSCICGDKIAQILGDADCELTPEQIRNRALIKGEIND